MRIDLLVDQCSSINLVYLSHLQVYVKEIIRRERQEDIDDEESELGWAKGIRKLMGKDTTILSTKLSELRKSKGYLVPVSFQAIRDTIIQFLVRKGWQ